MKNSKINLDKRPCTSCSGTLAMLGWVELLNTFERVSQAVLSLGEDSEEHSAYATMDLLTLITEEINARLYAYHDKSMVQ